MDPEQIKAQLKRIADEAGDKVTDIEARLIELEQKAARRPGGPAENGAHVSAFATKFDEARHAQAAELAESMKTRDRWTTMDVPATLKSFLGVTEGNSPNGAFPTLPQRIGVVDLVKPVTLLDALPTGTMIGSSIDVPKFDASDSSNAAAIVAEGEVKPTSSIIIGVENQKPLTFAHLAQFSEQFQQDQPAFSGTVLQNKMRQWLLQAISAEILNGNAASERFSGLLHNASTVSAPDSPTHPNDLISYAAYVLGNAGYEASLVIVNPLDAWSIINERSSGDGQYVGGVKFGGLPRVELPSLSQGTALILDTRGVAIFERSQVRFEIGRTADDFKRNLFTARCEARLAFSVLDAGTIRKVTF